MLKTSTGSCLITVLVYCCTTTFFFISSSSSSSLNRNHLHEIFLNNPLSSISLPGPCVLKTTYQQGDCNKDMHFQSVYQTINPVTTKNMNFLRKRKKNHIPLKDVVLFCCQCFVFFLPQPPLPKKEFGVLKAL